MNYLAHAHRYLANPAFALGTQVPDFLNMIDRRTRARSKQAAVYLDSSDAFLAELAAGVVQHHRDDQAFHNGATFLSLQERLSSHIRKHFPDSRGLRSWFSAHIAIEMLLDWALDAESESLLDVLYSLYRETNVRQFQEAVEVLTGRSLPTFPQKHEFFLRERFLYDYATDSGLAYRINRILQHVGLEPFSDSQLTWIPLTRGWVWEERMNLLPSATIGQ